MTHSTMGNPVDDQVLFARDENPWTLCGYQQLSRSRYGRGELSVALGDLWLSVKAPAQENRPQLDSPGCWKPDGASFDLFHLPAGALGAAGDIAGETSAAETVRQATDWFATTRRGEVPADWKVPEAAVLRQGVDAANWSVQVGSHLRTIDLELAPQRLALRIVLATSTEPLSAARQLWLQAKVEFENRHWRWVRLGLTGALEQPQVVAQIDLTGCPPSLLSALVLPALWALRLVAEHLLPSAVLLTSSRVCCESWEQSGSDFAASFAT